MTIRWVNITNVDYLTGQDKWWRYFGWERKSNSRTIWGYSYSFIVELKPTAAGNINETLQVLTPELAAAGGTVSAVYDQFGMFGLKFEGPQEDADQFITTLKENPEEYWSCGCR